MPQEHRATQRSPQPRAAQPDDTAAFQRFYAGAEEPPGRRGLLYRLLVGWWRDRR